MRKLLPLLLLVVVAGLVLLALLWRSGRERAIAVTRASEVVQADKAASSGEPPQAELATQPDAREERKVAESIPAPAIPVAESKQGETTLIVHAIGKTDRAPLSGIRVMLFPSDPAAGDHAVTHIDGSKGNLHQGPITGKDGKVEFDLPPGIEVELHATAEDGESGSTNTNVSALRAGEQRELTVELPQGNDGHVVGRVVEGESSSPLAGARIRLVDAAESYSNASGSQWTQKDIASSTTGNDGVFDFRFPSWKRPHLRVEAEGFGLRLVNPSKDHEDLQHALLVKLTRAGTLDARVLDSAGHGIAGASVVLDAHGYALNHDEDGDRGFFTSEYVSLPDEQWKRETSADGRATIQGLPSGVALTIEVRQAGKVLHHEPGELTLAPGQTKEIEWRIGSGTQLNGLVLDQDNQPVAKQEIWLQQRRFEMGFYFQSYDSERVVAKRATTDKEGRFVIADVPRGRWWIGPAADDHDEGLHARANAVAPFGESIETAGEVAHELTLHVSRGLYIRGKILSPKGEPVKDAFVQGAAEGVMCWNSARSGEDGSFAYGPLMPGKFTLTTSTAAKYAASDPVVAQAGDKDVVLQLRLGGGLRGRVIDAATGKGCQAQLMFAPEQKDSKPFGHGMITSTQADGTFQHDGFEPGRYAITAMSADGRFAQQVGLDLGAGTEVGDLVLALTPGGRLQLDNQGSKKQMHVVITQNGAPVSFGDSVPAEKSKELLAPAGSLVLEVRADFTAAPRKIKVELGVGETKNVVIEDEE